MGVGWFSRLFFIKNLVFLLLLFSEMVGVWPIYHPVNAYYNLNLYSMAKSTLPHEKSLFGHNDKFRQYWQSAIYVYIHSISIVVICLGLNFYVLKCIIIKKVYLRI